MSRGRPSHDLAASRTSAGLPEAPAPAARIPAALLALGGAHVLLMLGVVLARIRHPFELEWMEGAMVDQVGRVLAAQPLYARPSLDFVSFNYPPLYYWASAGMGRLLGEGFFPLRLVSFLSSLVCMGLIFALARRASGSVAAGFMSAALFAAIFKLGGAWFDIARVDMLALALLLGAFWLLRGERGGWAAGAAAGALLGLAFLTKQLMLVAAAPLLGAMLFARPGRALAALGSLALVGGGGTAWLAAADPHWYVFHVFEVPRHLKFSPSAAPYFWVQDLFGTQAIVCVLAGFHVVARWGRERSAAVLDLAMLAGLLLASWLPRLAVGGYNNVLVPAFAGLAILFGPALQGTLAQAAAAPAPTRRMVNGFVGWMCALQLLLLAYNPAPLVPPLHDRFAGEAFVKRVRSIHGDVYIPYHGYLGPMAGKAPRAHWIAVMDVINADPRGEGARLQGEIEAAFQEQRFAAVIMDRSLWMVDLLDRHYQAAAGAFEDEHGFWPVTGLRTRPEYVYVRRPKAP